MIMRPLGIAGLALLLATAGQAQETPLTDDFGNIITPQARPDDAPLTDEYGNILTPQSSLPEIVQVRAVTAPGGIVRVLDKISGTVTDLELRDGDAVALGSLTIALTECRYPSDNPAGDAFALLTILYRDAVEPVFQGWMIASSPALNAMDHPRYDVWVMRCITP
jgi:hypothetical protein